MTVLGGGGTTTIGDASLTDIASISNGLCRFNPTSPKGKWIFLLQTVLLSFTPITILVIQNGIMFKDMIIKKDTVLQKSKLVCTVAPIMASWHSDLMALFPGR